MLVVVGFVFYLLLVVGISVVVVFWMVVDVLFGLLDWLFVGLCKCSVVILLGGGVCFIWFF